MLWRDPLLCPSAKTDYQVLKPATVFFAQMQIRLLFMRFGVTGSVEGLFRRHCVDHPEPNPEVEE